MLEIDKLNTAAVLLAEAKMYPGKITPLLWMCFLVHFWGLEWNNDPEKEHVLHYQFGQHLLPYYDKGDAFDRFKLFTNPQTLTIPAEGKVHVFDKVVCVRGAYIGSNGKCYEINPYDLKTNLAIKDTEKQRNVLYRGHSNNGFYLLKGAVEIRYGYNKPETHTTLSYIEIEL